MKRLLSLAIAILSALLPALSQQTLRPVTSAYTFEAGSAHLCDTYLTPLRYSGWNVALGYERLQAMRFNPRRWVMRLDARAFLSRTLNPAGNAAMWQIGLRPSWSMMWRTDLPHGFTIAAGGNIGADLGVLYLMRNSNNPASARASVTLGATGMAVWNGKIGSLPVTLRYQPTLPLTGVFFSPDYDELYYEIWLGNHSGLAHAAWPGNFFRFDNLLTADLRFGATTLRVGYRCEVFSSKVSGIVSRDITHSLVIGIATEWLSLRSGSRHTPDADIISALYR